MKQYYLGLDRYDGTDFMKIISDTSIKGIVLGDLFCNNRMFKNGIMDLITLIDMLDGHKKTLIFQCPIYVTSRDMEQINFLLEYIGRKNIKTLVIVHDIGCVNMIRRKFKRYGIIWGRMARFRDYTLNRDFLELLKIIGVSGIELCDLNYRELVEKSGLIPYVVYGEMKYQTIGRQCYNKYQDLGCCREDCLSGKYSMNDTESNFKMSINGYIMGERFVYTKENIITDDDAAEQVIYASGIERYKNYTIEQV